MPKSSAWGIPYEIRPSKQVERRLVMDIVDLARGAGLEPKNLPFIGMGGVRFIDFLLAHKVLGINRFISLEHDETLWSRCNLNKPFDDLEIFEGEAASFINERGFDNPSFVWFDLEKMASKDAQEDIVAAATAVKPGTFLFATATAELPSQLDSMKMKARLAHLRSQFGPLANDIPEEWMNKKKFHLASANLAGKFLNFGFGGRIDGKFYPLINIAYKDSNWMATVGGFFGNEIQGASIQHLVRDRHPYLAREHSTPPFVLEQFNITEREKHIFDRAATAMPRRSSAKNQLRKLGFRDSIVDQYSDLMRFIPRYVETLF